MKIFRAGVLILSISLFLVSCQKEEEPFTSYIDLQLSGEWQDFIIKPNETIIMKVTIATESKLDISWKDVNAMKVDDSYSADIKVSAFRPDGLTPYFEDIDNGYQENSQIVSIEPGDDQVLLFIDTNGDLSGSFSIRVRGIYDNVVTNPKDLMLSDQFSDKNIGTGETKWLKVDCGAYTNISAEWMEFDRPETGSNYTADIQVSIYSEDLSVIYVDNKNHGYGTNIRNFILTHGTSIIYVKVSLYDPLKPGTYAIRVFGQTI